MEHIEEGKVKCRQRLYSLREALMADSEDNGELTPESLRVSFESLCWEARSEGLSGQLPPLLFCSSPAVMTATGRGTGIGGGGGGRQRRLKRREKIILGRRRGKRKVTGRSD